MLGVWYKPVNFGAESGGRSRIGRYVLGYLEKGIQTPMAQGRSTKIISMMKWSWTGRLSIKKSFWQVKTMRPAEAREMYANGTMPTFDAVVSFSSVEHSGPPTIETPYPYGGPTAGSYIPMEGLQLDPKP